MQMGRWYRIALRFGGEHEKRAGIAQCTCYACCGKQGSGLSNQHRGGVVNVRMQFVQLQVSSDTPDDVSKAGKLGPTLVPNMTLSASRCQSSSSPCHSHPHYHHRISHLFGDIVIGIVCSIPALAADYMTAVGNRPQRHARSSCSRSRDGDTVL